MLSRHFALILALAVSLALSACGGSNGSGGSGGDASDTPPHDEPPAPPEPDPEPSPPEPEPTDPTVSVEEVQMPPVGRVTLFEASFAPSGVMFASTAEEVFGDGADGIWRSTSGGQLWTKVFDQPVTFISILSGDPDSLVAGGDSFYAISNNGGTSWVTGTLNERIFGSPLPIGDAAGHTPAQGIYLASTSALQPGLYRSIDRGNSWQHVFTEDDVAEFGEPRLGFVAVAAADPSEVYTSSIFNSDIWKSVNSGGDFFSIKTGLAVGTNLSSGAVINPRDAAQIFMDGNVSVNGGGNWSKAELSPQNTVWYQNALLRLQIGSFVADAILISQDFGSNWQKLAELEGLSSPMPSDVWKSEDSLFFGDATQGLIYRIDLSEIDQAMSM